MPKTTTERIRRIMTRKNVRNAIKDSGGIILTIADKLGVEWHTVKKYLAKHPDLKEIVDRERERTKDKAESSLIKALTKDESWAVKYFLSTQAKDRGYTYKTDITSNGQTIDQGVVLVLPDNNRGK